MKKRALFAGFAYLLVSPALAQGWSEYRNDEGNFQVQMPGSPKLNTAQIPIGNNETAPMTEAAVRAPGAAYQVSYIVYPPRITGSAAPDVILDTFRNSMSAGHGYLKESKLMLGRFSGREFTVTESSTRHTAVRLYWIRGKLYQLMATGAPGIEAKPDTRKFFDSFGLIKV